MKYVLLALTSLCALAITLSSCYWLAQYGDLSSAFGDAGPNADAQSPGGGAGRGSGGSSGNHSAQRRSARLLHELDGVDAGELGLQVYGANVAIVDGTYVSPPSSLFVELQGAASFGRYPVSFPFQPTTTRLEFQIRIADLEEGVTTLAITLSEASTQTLRTLNVVVAPYGGFQVQEYFALADGGTEI